MSYYENSFQYFANAAGQEKPGIFIQWDRNPGIPVGSYEILRSEAFNGTYQSIAVLPFPKNEYIDKKGHPGCYYRIRQLAPNNAAIDTSQPINGDELLIKASLLYQVKDLLHLDINNEAGIFSRDRTYAKWTFGNWSYWERPEIRISGSSNDGDADPMAILDEDTPLYRTAGNSDNYTGGLRYKADYQGRVYFVDVNDTPVPIHQYDVVEATYYVSLFTGREMNDALYMALQTINAQPGADKYPIVGSVPFYYDAALVAGATYFLLRSLLVGLNQREKRLLMMDPDNGAFNTVQELRETAKMYQDDWKELLKSLPKARYPTITSIVTPEFFLPGGRSRFFRSVWKGSTG